MNHNSSDHRGVDCFSVPIIITSAYSCTALRPQEFRHHPVSPLSSCLISLSLHPHLSPGSLMGPEVPLAICDESSHSGDNLQ